MSVLYFPVTGEANFSMKSTSLTVGGFNQPSVARSLIELAGNAEKGLSQRFLWFFPKPVYGDFDSLEPIDRNFTDKIGMLMVNVIATGLVYMHICTNINIKSTTIVCNYLF